MEKDPCSSVVEDGMLVGEILHRIPSSKSYIRSSAVSPLWLNTARSRSISDLFVEKNTPTFLGFMVEFKTVSGLGMRLLTTATAASSETWLAMRAEFDEQHLRDLEVVATSGATVLYRVTIAGNFAVGYHSNCPFSRPDDFYFVGNLMPSIPRVLGEHTYNILGQYGVLMRTRKRVDSPMAFFVKDFVGRVIPLYEGIRFGSNSSVSIHVSVHTEGNWNRFVSDPLVVPPYATFHRTPYCVLVGSELYMMYLVGFIVSFDLGSCTFKVVNLPAAVPTEGLSWFDYTVSKTVDGSLALVNFNQGVLNRWVLVADPETVLWRLDSTLNLAQGFGSLIRNAIPLIDFAIDRGFVQVRCASEDSRYIFMTVGVNSALFVTDMMEKTFIEVPNIVAGGNLGRIFKLGENWPPLL